MTLEEAQLLTVDLIETGRTHLDYAHTVDLAETYKTYITGKNIAKKLVRFTQREDLALFEQRLKLTCTTTPAVASTIRQPFNKVVRNDRIRKDIGLKNKSKVKTVEDMAAMFYGNKRSKNKGLDYWLTTRFLEMQFTDPNSWVVVEWDTPEDEATVIKPRPFEVNAASAVNFFIENDEVKWLFVKQSIQYIDKKGATPAKDLKKPGARYTLYEETFTLVYTQIGKNLVSEVQLTLADNQRILEINKNFYVETVNTPNIGYVPAFRIGYKRDEETEGRTFVNPWHDALCYFEKSLKTVSELDLTQALHTFPQKLQYVRKCNGTPQGENTPARGCNNGYVQGTPGVVCGGCKGLGYKVHTTAQDALLIPLPDDPRNEDIIDLEKLIHYEAPPMELIEFQNKYALQLESQASQAVFNSQLFTRKVGGEIQTATAENIDYESVYDTLEPFTEKYSEMWREFITIFAVIAAEPLEGIDITHEFPADYKLKTIQALMSERKTAKDSSAPAFLIEAIDDDIAGIRYEGDALAMDRYRVKRRFFPFTGKSEDEIGVLLASEFVPDELKILYCNFEPIFKEIELEKPEFWTMKDRDAQKIIVDDKVTQWKEKLSQANPAPQLGNFRVGPEGVLADEEPEA